MSELFNKNDKIKVEKYKFEDLPPIKGFPELKWRGKRPYDGTQFYPAQLKESYGKSDKKTGWMNKIFWGDNLQVMSHLLKSYRGKVDLVYIDPPFASGEDYKKKIKLNGLETKNDHTAFEDKQYGDMWNNDEYLQFMYERLRLIRELLSPTGSIYLHCDWHESHHLRCLMDEVFGNGGDKGKDAGFKNEIIWYYKNASRGKDNLAFAHDSIFWYTKTSNYKFNLDEILAPFESGMTEWRYTKGGQKGKEKPKGKTPDNIIIMPSLNAMANEREGYSTQKPEELIEQFIKTSSNPGDLVFDCFMGSGTTMAVAEKLGRRFIGADINLGSIEITNRRLNKIITDDKSKVGFEVYNVNNYDVFRNPIEAKDILIEALELEKFDKNTTFDGEKDGWKYKILSVNRIASKEDLNDLIQNLDYKKMKKAQNEHPNKPVEKIALVCMGHEPDLAATLLAECKRRNFNIDVQIIDILQDNKDLEFKRKSEAKISIKKNKLVIDKFYPMNLLGKLSLQKSEVENWKQLVESVKIDWNFSGIFEPEIIDYPENKKDLVDGTYEIPEKAGHIKVKITDLLEESFETEFDIEE